MQLTEKYRKAVMPCMPLPFRAHVRVRNVETIPRMNPLFFPMREG